MKKLIVTGVIAALAFSSVAQAELQISGNVTTLAGYQHDDKDAAVGPAGGLTQGDLRFAPTANADHFGFAVDQAEIDVENEFGENIMARIDVDFFDLGTPGANRNAGGVFLEQAYVTANLGIGNGMEFLIGKFNAPVGLENIDRHENVFSTYTPGWIFMTPTSVIGAKIYYEFNDHWNFDLAVVNSLNNNLAGNSAYPSALLRVGAQWGEEGRLSYIHLGAGFGPELNAVNTATADNGVYDLYGTLWGNWAIGDFWDIGWEGIYRQTGNEASGGTSQKGVAAQLYVVYQPSDVWTVQWRGATAWDLDADTGTGSSRTGATWHGFEGMTYSGTVGATYQITDGAKLKFEYRFDFASTTGATLNADYHTGVAEFAYSF